MSRTDLLDHPELRKIWTMLEASQLDPDWEEIAGPNRTPRVEPRRRGLRALRRGITVLAALGLVLFASSETIGVFAARRALAAVPAISGEAIRLEVVTVDAAEPWLPVELTDLNLTDIGILANTFDAKGASNPWQLTADGWVRLNLDTDLVTAGEIVGNGQYLTTRSSVGEDGDTAVIWSLGSDAEEWRQGLSLTGGHFASLDALGDRLIAAGYRDLGTLRAWSSPDGVAWSPMDVERARRSVVNAGASNGQTAVVVGYEDASVPLIETRNAAIWRTSDGADLSAVELPNLSSLGFGYSIGGFRLADGLERVVVGQPGFIAYTGYLQVWDGFSGLTLEPREAWASLLLVSPDGSEWEAHVLIDLAIYQMVPFGDGWLAAAAVAPDKDTESVAVDGVVTEVAASTVNKLYYSADGLSWQEVADSPEFGKPLLATLDDGGAIAVDEYAAEDRNLGTTTVHLIRPQP